MRQTRTTTRTTTRGRPTAAVGAAAGEVRIRIPARAPVYRIRGGERSEHATCFTTDATLYATPAGDEHIGAWYAFALPVPPSGIPAPYVVAAEVVTVLPLH